MKRLIIFVIIGNLLYNFWGTFKADISVYEAVLLVLSDKLMLATAFTLPVLLLVSNVFNFRRYELQIMLRLGSTKRWFWANVLSSSVLVLIYIVGLLSVFAAVGILVTVISQVLKHSGREEHAFLTSLAGLLIVLFWIVPYIYELFETMQSLFAL